MAIEPLFNATCTISRFTAGGVDAYGQPTGSWADLATGVKCRIQEMALNQNWALERIGPGGTAIEASHKMWIGKAQSITEKDRVTTVVVDGDAAVYAGLTFDVQYCAPSPGGKRHHREIFVKVIRA
jgi:hypothetical protein